MKELELTKDAYVEWKNFPSEKAKAEKGHKLFIASLRAQIAEANETFKDTWTERKEQVRNALDTAAVSALQAGLTPNKLLVELGSSNPTWAYNLLRVGAPTPTTEEPKVHPLLEGVVWDYSDHSGTHGVLRSADKTLFKFYSLTEPDVWFIVDNSLELVTGSSALFESQTKPEIERRADLLASILDGHYTGPLRLQHNRFTN